VNVEKDLKKSSRGICEGTLLAFARWSWEAAKLQYNCRFLQAKYTQKRRTGTKRNLLCPRIMPDLNVKISRFLQHLFQLSTIFLSSRWTLVSYCSWCPPLSWWIYLSMALYPLLGLGRFFSSLIFYTVGRTPWTGDRPVARPLPANRTAQTQKKGHKYPLFKWDSNPRSQCSSGRRQFMS
jgi:hypothetical protein